MLMNIPGAWIWKDFRSKRFRFFVRVYYTSMVTAMLKVC